MTPSLVWARKGSVLRAAAFLGNILGALAVASPEPEALAQGCGWPGPNCYAIAWEDGGGTVWEGVEAQWDIQNLYAPDWWEAYWGFVLQDLWAVMNPPSGSYEGEWVEVGYRHGWRRQNITTFFWAERVEGWGFQRYRITWPPPGPVGTPHHFRIEQTGWGDSRRIFKVFIDGICVEAWDDGNPVPCESWQYAAVRLMEVGAEATSAGAQLGLTHAWNFRHRDSSGGWSDWSPSTPYVDNPNRDRWVWATRLALSTPYTKTGSGYGMKIEYYALDPIPADYPDGFHSNAALDSSDWVQFEQGGPIYVHEGGGTTNHLHIDYNNPSSYVLLTRNHDGYAGNLVVEFGFGDSMAPQMGVFAGVWKQGRTNWMVLGVHTGMCPNHYYYRWGMNPSTDYTCTSIPREFGWHTFRFYVRSDGTFGELDGTSLEGVRKNTDITPSTLGEWGAGATWGLTALTHWDDFAYFRE